jgi:hypothetical protein
MLVAGGCAALILPVYHWARFPELSQMQVFLATWKPNILGCLALSIGMFLSRSTP